MISKLDFAEIEVSLARFSPTDAIWNVPRTHRRPTIIAFFDLESAMVLINRIALFNTLYAKRMPERFVNLRRALYSHTYGQVSLNGELPSPFETTSGVPSIHFCLTSSSECRGQTGKRWKAVLLRLRWQPCAFVRIYRTYVTCISQTGESCSSIRHAFLHLRTVKCCTGPDVSSSELDNQRTGTNPCNQFHLTRQVLE